MGAAGQITSPSRCSPPIGWRGSATSELKEAERFLSPLSSVDVGPLTGVANRRSFERISTGVAPRRAPSGAAHADAGRSPILSARLLTTALGYSGGRRLPEMGPRPMAKRPDDEFPLPPPPPPVRDVEYESYGCATGQPDVVSGLMPYWDTDRKGSKVVAEQPVDRGSVAAAATPSPTPRRYVHPITSSRRRLAAFSRYSATTDAERAIFKLGVAMRSMLLAPKDRRGRNQPRSSTSQDR